MDIKSRLKRWFAPEKRALLSRYWLVINLLYDLARAYVVNMLFSRHGVNGYVYLAISLGFSAIFSLCSIRLVFSIADRDTRKFLMYSVLTVISFFAPDAYIVLKGHNIPIGAYIGLALYLSITTFITARSILHDVASKRF